MADTIRDADTLAVPLPCDHCGTPTTRGKQVEVEGRGLWVGDCGCADGARIPFHIDEAASEAHAEDCHNEDCYTERCAGSETPMTETGECPRCGAIFCIDCGSTEAAETNLGTCHAALCDDCRDARAGRAPTA